MLESLFGIRLLLWIGQTVPLPASYEAATSLAGVEVTNDSSKADGFKLTFAVGRNGVGDYGLLQSGELAPMNRVIVGVIFGVVPEVLIDGIITQVHLDPSSTPGQSTLTVMGQELAVLMDLEEKNLSYENQPDSVIAMRVLTGYAQYGIIPQPSATTDVPIQVERIPRQQETDLKFLLRLAQRNGFVFYLEPETVGMNRAYWGPENRLGIPQPALSMDMGASTNVASLAFSDDALAATATKGTVIEPITRTSLPIPPLPSLRIPPLVTSPARAYRTTLQRETANQSPTTAATRSLASTTNAPDSATAQGEADGVRYGSALRARRLVGVRGAGSSHDGLWYVKAVTHTISRGQYTQRFSLSREGIGTLTPVVLP